MALAYLKPMLVRPGYDQMHAACQQHAFHPMQCELESHLCRMLDISTASAEAQQKQPLAQSWQASLECRCGLAYTELVLSVDEIRPCSGAVPCMQRAEVHTYAVNDINSTMLCSCSGVCSSIIWLAAKCGATLILVYACTVCQ